MLLLRIVLFTPTQS